MIKEELTDEELLYLYEAGSDSAKSALFDRYYNYSVGLGKYYYKMFKRCGISIEEYTAVAFSKFDEALKSHKKIRIDLLNYWKLLVKNAVYDYIRKNSYTLGARAFMLSLDDTVVYDDDDPLYLHDVVGDLDEVISDSRSIMGLIKAIVETDEYDFTSEEREIVRLTYLEGYEIEESAKILNISSNHAYYIAKMVKRKISEIIKDSYL